MNNYRKQEFVRSKIRELIDDGLVQMRNPELSNEFTLIWIDYSRQILEIATKDYNPDIVLNYIRVIMSIQPHLMPYQKIGICLDYLIGALRII